MGLVLLYRPQRLSITSTFSRSTYLCLDLRNPDGLAGGETIGHAIKSPDTGETLRLSEESLLASSTEHFGSSRS